MGSELRRIVTNLALMLVGLYILFLSGPSWDAPSAAMVFYSVLAFLSVAMTTCAANRIRTDPSSSHNAFVAGTSYSSIVFAGAAVFYIFTSESPVVHTRTAGIFLNLVALATTGLIMLLHSHLNRTIPEESSFAHRKMIIPVIVTTGIVIFAMSMVFSRLPLDQWVFLLAGYIVGVIAIVSYLVAAIMTFRQKDSPSSHDPVRMALAFGLLAAASIVHTAILSSPSSLWIVSISLMAIAFVFAVVATGYPFLVDIGIKGETAYRITVAISILVVLPFLIANFVEAWTPFISYADIAVTMLIHFAAAILAASAAYALLVRTRYRTEYHYSPIVYLFLTWTVAEIAIIASHLTPVYGTISESAIPYVCGIIASTVFLTIAVRRTLVPPPERSSQTSATPYILWLFGFSLMILTGEFIRLQLIDSFTAVSVAMLVNAIMLSLSCAAFFALLNFIILITGSSGGELSFDTFTASLASLWVVVVILKVNFSDWTAGWWAAEILILIAITVLPLVLLRKHLTATSRMSKLEIRILTHSRLLSNSITSLHTSAIDSLGSLSMDSTASDTRLESVAQALADISRANELAFHMEAIIAGNRFARDRLEAVDLVDSIITGVTRLTNLESDPLARVQINRTRGECFVIANSLLADVFHSILSGILRRIGSLQSMTVEIDSEKDNSQPIWMSRITVELGSADADKKRELFERYTKDDYSKALEFAYARRLVQLFGGHVRYHVTTTSEQGFTSIFVISLPSVEES